MSKHPRKNGPSRRQKIPSLPKQQRRKHSVLDSRFSILDTRRGSGIKYRVSRFVVFVIVAILAAIPFSMGKYFEFNTPGPYDSGAYVYSAKHILDGAEIGVEEKPSAQVGTLLVNMLGVWLFGFSETGPELIQTALQAAALVLMFIAMRKLFGSLPAAVGVIVASVYLSSPLIAKFGNVKEQYMIAFMVMGISCFVLHQLTGRWWYAFLAGALVSWAPLFKATGTAAIGAIGLFVIAQPLLKNRTWKQTGLDILLLLAGAAAAIGPLYIWIIGWNVKMGLPYSFAWMTLAKFLPTGHDAEQTKTAAGYVAAARKLVPFSQQWPMVLRYYWLLRLPVALAVGAIIARIVRMIWSLDARRKKESRIKYRESSIVNQVSSIDRFVLLFAAWWLLDMAFVWISPRSYEQYYLPLNASAAMLGGYLIALYCDKFSKSPHKSKWGLIGAAGFVCMIIMSSHIFFGIKTSPHSGMSYGGKRRGYSQKLDEISGRRKNNWKGPWEVAGEYIRINSEPTDRIYVWGWYPGIYVKAQRLSAASHACMMPRPAPQILAEIITELLTEFEQQRPKFIVDSRKRHVPMDRPPYELWPRTQNGFLPPDKAVMDQYDAAYSKLLSEKFDRDEALRYEKLRPFREFVMENYKIVEPIQRFWPHVVFQLKNDSVKTTQ